ncbi:MAG: nicotinamide mononucleotide transporter [Saprospiraceae bacterium]|nr:nicotinamide mononucleotide transporter [Saprospiraceae bacterium]
MEESFFSVGRLMFSILGYGVSYIEFLGTIFGICAVWLAAKSKMLTWPVGLINVVLFFMIYFQVQLYADMFLQIYFFAIGLYGWIFWKKEEEQRKSIHALNRFEIVQALIWILLLTAVLGWMISKIHLWWPALFNKEAAFPYWDTLVAVASIFANTLLARRVIQNWPIWIAVDLICIVLYISKGIYFVAFEFVIFTLLACLGWYEWNKKFQLQSMKSIATT